MPESIHDPILGPLNLNDWLQGWTGKVNLSQDHSVEIFISPGNNSIGTILSWVRPSFVRIRDKDIEYRHWTAENVIDVRWNSEEEMTVEEIATLSQLASIDFHSDGRASLYWDDKDRLYGGNNLITELDVDGRCTEVRIEG